MEAAIASLSRLVAHCWTHGRAVFHEGWKYLLVSAAALAVDFGLLVLLTERGGLHYLVSAAVGFGAGLIVNYLLSVALVFKERRLSDRRLQFLGFMAIGLVALLLNEALLGLFVEHFGLGYAVAKAPAAAIGFMFNFSSRRVLLFTAPPNALPNEPEPPRRFR